MKYTNRTMPAAQSIPRALLWGLLASWAVTLALTVLITFLLDLETIEQTHLAPSAVLSMILSTIAGTFVASKKAGQTKLLVSLASGGIYFLSLLGCNAAFYGATFEGIIPSLLCAVGGSLTVGLLEIRQKGESVKHMKRLYKS